MLVRMLEIMPLEGEDKEAMASSKEAAPKGGTDNSSLKGKKRAASDDPETMVSKRGRKSSSEGPTPGSSLAGLRPRGSALQRAVSGEKIFLLRDEGSP